MDTSIFGTGNELLRWRWGQRTRISSPISCSLEHMISFWNAMKTVLHDKYDQCPILTGKRWTAEPSGRLLLTSEAWTGNGWRPHREMWPAWRRPKLKIGVGVPAGQLRRSLPKILEIWSAVCTGSVKQSYHGTVKLTVSNYWLQIHRAVIFMDLYS